MSGVSLENRRGATPSPGGTRIWHLTFDVPGCASEGAVLCRRLLRVEGVENANVNAYIGCARLKTSGLTALVDAVLEMQESGLMVREVRRGR